MMVFSTGTLERMKHTIQVLQQLQRLLPIEATLSDVADLLACIEVEFGSEMLLEDVIQHLVGEHLAVQLAQRSVSHQTSQAGLEVAA